MSSDIRKPDIISILALVVSFAAAIFTGLQWVDAHNQPRLSMRPLVDFDTEDDPHEPPVGITIMNDGPGPAIIKSLTYYVDRKPVKDLSDVARISHINPDHWTYLGFDENDALATGQKYWLIKYLRRNDLNQKELDRFTDLIDQHLAIEVNFCSMLGDCWSKCSSPGHC